MTRVPAEDTMRELAAPYALGALGQHEARAFEEHLEDGCGECAAELREMQEVAASLAVAAPALEPPAGARERLLARVAAEEDVRREPRGGGEEGARRAPQFTGASDFVVVRKDEGEWFETADAGVFAKVLFVDRERDTVTSLVRLSPGSRIRPHRHKGVEQCLILEGEMRSGDMVMGAGDFNCAMSESVHNEIYTETGALFLIVAPESYEVLAPS